MRITILASHGTSSNLVALQAIVINLDSNSDVALGQEPEVDIEDNKVHFLKQANGTMFYLGNSCSCLRDLFALPKTNLT